MNDLFRVHILEALANLFKIVGNLGLRNSFFFSNLHQRSIGHDLKDEVNMTFIMKKAIKRSEMSMF
jgi:hypothetical protein